MDGISATSAVLGLAIPAFTCAKAVRDIIKQVEYEKAELRAVISQYEKDINLLESLYNENKALLDQHCLDTDLREFGRIVYDLHNWLDTINMDLHKKTRPNLKELWRAGDLREKIAVANAAIGGIRKRWEMRLSVSTLASTRAIWDSQVEMKAALYEIKSMLQQEPIRQRALSLLVHSQVEPAGFSSQTTRVITNETRTGINFCILSPDTSLSYDRITLRLEEYRRLLASDSDSIELLTENGKTVVCRKQAAGMEQFLDQAEILLQDVVQSGDTSTLVALQRLRDLSKVLDNLKLYDECRLTGNFALDLSEALGRESLELRREQAETIALIAGLSVYQPRARTLFTQAVTIMEEVVASHASDSNKKSLLSVLHRAGYWLKEDPKLSVRWLEHAEQLMTTELPSMVPDAFRSTIYFNYGVDLRKLKRYADAVEAQHKAVSIRRTLASKDPVTHTPYLARALENLGMSLDDLSSYDAAAAAYKEAVQHWRTASPLNSLRYNYQLAKILYNYGITLQKLKQFSEAADVNKEAVSRYRSLADTEAHYKGDLIDALANYGHSCHSLGHHTEAVIAYQEYTSLQSSLITKSPEEEEDLFIALHNMAISFHTLGKDAEADTAATAALQMNQESMKKICKYAPDFSSCFVCQKVNTPDPRTIRNDTLAPLPTPLRPSSPPSTEPRDHSETSSSLIPAPSTPSTYRYRTNAPDSLGFAFGQPRVVPNSPLPPGSPSSSYHPSIHPQIQGHTESSVHLPRSSEGTQKMSLHGIKKKLVSLFRRNEAE